nr:divergent polysaccharide deacetylase family protein [Marinibactrum halimedae]
MLILICPPTVGGKLVVSAQSETPKLAIIIDDIGYHHRRGMWAATTTAPLTLAVLPFSPHAKSIVSKALNHNKEIMIHSPMTSIDGRRLDEGALEIDMPEEAFKQTLNASLQAIPEAVGLNNHMGSALTQELESMSWLMQVLKKNNMYFIDSRTTAQSIAYDVAQSEKIHSLKRDVFLDNIRTHAAITQQLEKALLIAQEKGFAVAIGHPYQETLTVIDTYINKSENTSVEWVTVSDLLKHSETINETYNQENTHSANYPELLDNGLISTKKEPAHSQRRL